MIGIVVVLVIGIAATGWFIDSGPGFGGLGALVAVHRDRGARSAATTGTARCPGPARRRPRPGRPAATGPSPVPTAQTPGTAYAAAPTPADAAARRPHVPG